MADKYEYSEKVTTPVFRGAFARFFEPEINDKGKKTWGVTAIFPKGTDIGVLKSAAVEAAKKAWGDKWETTLKHPKFRSPFKDGATMVNKAGELYAGFEAGQFVVKLSTSQQAPGLVDAKVQAIIEPSEAYSGAWYKATVNAMAYDRPDGMGISFKLNNVQKLKDDEKLGGGGRADPTTEFASAVAPGGEAPANADELWK
jgi:hypothetical protein